MKHQPSEFDERLLEQVLEIHWSMHVVELVYLPVGFGDHHCLNAGVTTLRVGLPSGDLDTRLNWLATLVDHVNSVGGERRAGAGIGDAGP